ncbi:class I SAM-dependent methyltransferase [bacterium]|nr:class I SAM-dependent methyltransferase [bacterium]
MSVINSDDYHDYVFKDGKFIGQFEQMYQKSKEIPWHQDKDPYLLDCKIALNILEKRAPYKSILDVGCGLGYFTKEAGKLCQKDGSVLGVDLSPTAVNRAKQLFSHTDFEVMDITRDLYAQNWKGRKYHLVIVRGLFWYVFSKIDRVCQNIIELIDKNGYLLIQQNFPPLDSNFVGKEILPKPESLLSYFKSDVTELIINYLEDSKQNQTNNNWIYMFGLKK